MIAQQKVWLKKTPAAVTLRVKVAHSVYDGPEGAAKKAQMIAKNRARYDPETAKGIANRQSQSVVQKALRDPSHPGSDALLAKIAVNQKAALDQSGAAGRKTRSARALRLVKDKVDKADIDAE